MFHVVVSKLEGVISSCSFSQLTAGVGAGISINNVNYFVKLSMCLFDRCVATSYTDSASREEEDNCSGGACYLNIKSTVISKTYSTLCTGVRHAHSFYIYTSNQINSSLSCISDSLSGKDVDRYSMVFLFDKKYV